MDATLPAPATMGGVKDKDWTVASDGIRARINGLWGKDKLSFLDEFLPAAMLATQRKAHRYYVDLFAGPGLNVDRQTREEFTGSAIRAAGACAEGRNDLHFTHAYLVNKDSEDQRALEQRIDTLHGSGGCRIPRKDIKFLTHDANRLVGRIMSEIDTRAYAFVFVDITRPSHWPWSSVQQLRSAGHQSVDLYLLFPLHMSLNRMMSFDSDAGEQSAAVNDAFFGTDEWRSIWSGRTTSSQSSEFRRRLLDLYTRRLKALGWKEAFVVRDVNRVGDAGLYKMIFASSHRAGANIARWSAENDEGGQGSLFQ